MNRLKGLVSVEWMLLLIWIIGFGCYTIRPLSDPDTPWHIATGMFILSHHYVPTTDPFSWTMNGKPWVTQEWLFETVLAWFSKHVAYLGVWFVIAAIHAGTVIVLYCLATRVSAGNRVIAAVVACVGTLSALEFWTMRPQTVSYLMFATFLWLLQMVREERFWVLWLVPPLFLVWANAHGSASIGIAMLLLEVVISFIPSFGRFSGLDLPYGARWRLLLAAVVGGACGLINPNGLKAYTYALLSTNSVMTNNILEWHSPDFHNTYFEYGVLPGLIVVLLILIAVWEEVPLRETIYFLGALAMTLIHQRFMPYLSIASVPLLASVLAFWGRSLLDPSWFMKVFNGLVSLATVGVFIHYAPNLRGPLDQHWDTGANPVSAVDYLKKNHLTGKLLNCYRFGGYLIYRGVPTFVDGRTDIFLQNSTFTDYLDLERVWPNCPNLLDQYGFQVVMFPPGYSILTYLEHNPNWRMAYQDGAAVIMVRQTSKPS